MRLLIYSSSRLTRLLIGALENMCPRNLELLVLRENHSDNELKVHIIPVLICENLKDAISQCDVMVILDNHKIPSYKKSYIEEQMSTKPVRTIIIDEEGTLNFDKMCCGATENQIPIIHNVGVCDAVSTARLEFVLHRLFREMKAASAQCFTNLSANLITQLHDCGLLNKFITFPQTAVLPSVYISSHCYHDIDSFLCDNAVYPKPDILFLTLPYRIREYDELRKYVEIRYSCNAFIINTDYIDISGDGNSFRYIYCCNEHGINSLDDLNTYNRIVEFIKTNITFPGSVKIIL